jgi:hypothetical protein
MSKDTVHQCIDENIVSNGKRGITAQSLANTLHLMVDEGGSGNGLLMVNIGTIVDNGEEMLTTILTNEEKERNKEIFNIVKEAAKNGESCPMVSFDYLKLISAMEPEISIILAGSSLSMFPMASGYMTGAILSESGLGYSELVMTFLLMGNMMIYIAPDGSVILDEG